ncbi:MAG: hypothetical protein GY696_14525 [Gammaproteobacteria bacterium]|nr:hypothetical protein [Gammaproteobacteria bacterium]
MSRDLRRELPVGDQLDQGRRRGTRAARGADQERAAEPGAARERETCG